MDTPTTFLTLASAVEHIAGFLDSDDPAGLAAQFAFYGAINPQVTEYTRQSFCNYVFADLLRRHQELDLRQRYQGREFPETEDHLTLGGHASELGHIHIIFVRTPEGWVLDEILMCC